jgi:hypothetical protein
MTFLKNRPALSLAIAGAALVWGDLDPFTRGYVEAMFADVCDDEVDVAGLNAFVQAGNDARLKYRPFGFSDLAPETLARIIADCEYVTANMRGKDRHVRELTDEGAAFWRARRGRGSYGLSPLILTIGEDGKVRFAGASR